MVSAVPLAPDPLFAPCAQALVAKTKKQYKLPGDFLLFVGSLEPRKNIDVLVEALLQLPADIPLVLTGWNGWGEKQWHDKIATTRLKNRVYVLGHVPDHDLSALYSGAAALVYPSLYEGFGLPIVEAMACGCPVICSNAASMPEVAGDAAMLIDPARADDLAGAITTVLEDDQIRQTLIRKGLARAASFSWAETARQTMTVFERVAR